MASINLGQNAAERTEEERRHEGIAGRYVPWANANYSLSLPPIPSAWSRVPDDPRLEIRGWLDYLNIWRLDRPLPPGVLWRTTGLWERGFWPPPRGEELALELFPLKEWLGAIPQAPPNPVLRHIVNLSRRRQEGANTIIVPHFRGEPTKRAEPRLACFAAGLGSRGPVAVAEDPYQALALAARGQRAVAIGNYAGRRKQGSLGAYILKETLNLILNLAEGHPVTVCYEPETKKEALQQVLQELEKGKDAPEIRTKAIQIKWPEFR